MAQISNGNSRSNDGSSSRQELIIQPEAGGGPLGAYLDQLASEGIRIIYADPATVGAAGGGTIKTMFAAPDADYVVVSEEDAAATAASPGSSGADRDDGGPAARQPHAQPRLPSQRLDGRPPDRKIGMRFEITSNADIEGVLAASAKHGLDFVIVDVRDWKIIPLENTIAKLHRMRTMLIASARTPVEVRKMFSILDVGVDGVIFAASSISQVRDALFYMGGKQFAMAPAKVVEIREVGDGERVCVDTASMLHKGEGMLIGSRSNFMFLVHNESVGSSFTSPRPFRVNAGAVHCYTPSPDGTTKYLSELETGSEVLILTPGGKARRVAVGRSKIERRPMLIIKAEADGEMGGIIAQDAETIRFVRPDGDLVSVTHLREGDEVMVHVREAAGRHFGMEVADEYILEK